MSKNEITTIKVICKKCSYEWKPKLKYPKLPKTCCRCKSSSAFGHIFAKLSNGKTVQVEYNKNIGV